MTISETAKVIILLILTGSAARAQNFRFGIHATPTLNWISTSQPKSDSETNLKFSFGLLAELDLAERYSVACGINIISRGGRIRIKDTLGNYRSDFIQIPIVLKMRTRPFGYTTCFAKFGGGLGIKTSEYSSIKPDLAPNERLDSYVNLFNALFIIGGGFEYSLGGESRIVFGIDYNKSLLDNLIDDDPRLEENYYYRFDYITFSFGFLF